MVWSVIRTHRFNIFLRFVEVLARGMLIEAFLSADESFAVDLS
jgi:hypothetical protein